MTIDTTVAKQHYIGQGQAEIFFIYRIDNLSEVYILHVGVGGGVETELTAGIDYTVAGLGDAGGVTITLTTALAVNERLVVKRDMPTTQESFVARHSGGWSPEQVELMFDRQAMEIQDLQEQIGRCIRAPISSQDDPGDLVMQPANPHARVLLAESVMIGTPATMQIGTADPWQDDYYRLTVEMMSLSPLSGKTLLYCVPLLDGIPITTDLHWAGTSTGKLQGNQRGATWWYLTAAGANQSWTEPGSGTMDIYVKSNRFMIAGHYCYGTGDVTYPLNTLKFSYWRGSGVQAINGLQFQYFLRNFYAGTFRLWGYPR